MCSCDSVWLGICIVSLPEKESWSEATLGTGGIVAAAQTALKEKWDNVAIKPWRCSQKQVN